MSRRVAKILLAVGSALLGAAPAEAAASRTGRPVCDALVAHEPRILKEGLLELSGPVLGKPPLSWNEEDFDRVYRAADYCDGLHDAGTNSMIRSSTWRANLDPAREVVLGTVVALREAESRRQNTHTKSVVLPACEKLLEWSHDPREFRNNSAALFGRDALDTPYEDLGAVMGYVKACAPAVVRIAQARMKQREEETQRRLASLMEVYGSIQGALAERRNAGQRATDMVAYMDGRAIPPTLASRRTQSLVRDLDRYAASRQRLPPDQIEAMNKEASAIAAEAKTRVEIVWAEAVKERISRDVFSEQP